MSSITKRTGRKQTTALWYASLAANFRYYGTAKQTRLAKTWIITKSINQLTCDFAGVVLSFFRTRGVSGGSHTIFRKAVDHFFVRWVPHRSAATTRVRHNARLKVTDPNYDHTHTPKKSQRPILLSKLVYVYIDFDTNTAKPSVRVSEKR